jgi:hypothetical protein
MSSFHTEKPLIFVIDIDGTIIGDIRPQVMLYEMNMAIKKIDKKINVFNAKEFQNKLRDGIIRPFFGKFIKKIKENYSPIEYFIYTASDKQWATFLVPHIEKSLGIKINRPIFTRQHCNIVNNVVQKSMNRITPDILKTLKKKYGNIKNIDDRVMIIDNIKVYEHNDVNKMIICPTYDFKLPENLPSIINEKIFKSHKELILNILNRYVTFPNINSYLEFQHAYYIYYIKYISSIIKSNDIQNTDKFFLYLMNIILFKKIKNFPPNTISYISNKINSKIT